MPVEPLCPGRVNNLAEKAMGGFYFFVPEKPYICV